MLRPKIEFETAENARPPPKKQQILQKVPKVEARAFAYQFALRLRVFIFDLGVGGRKHGASQPSKEFNLSGQFSEVRDTRLMLKILLLLVTKFLPASFRMN